MLDRLSPALTISRVTTGGTLSLHRDFTPPPDRVAIERAFAELTWAGTGAPIQSMLAVRVLGKAQKTSVFRARIQRQATVGQPDLQRQHLLSMRSAQLKR
jgi:hypothetical protein